MTTENYQKTKTLIREAEALRKWTNLILLLTAIFAGVSLAAMSVSVFGKRLLRRPHAYLADIKTEEDLLKLSKRQTKEVLEMCGVEIRDDADQEELLELLKQLWLQEERSPALN